jgi:hypothetical protein
MLADEQHDAEDAAEGDRAAVLHVAATLGDIARDGRGKPGPVLAEGGEQEEFAHGGTGTRVRVAARNQEVTEATEPTEGHRHLHRYTLVVGNATAAT